MKTIFLPIFTGAILWMAPVNAFSKTIVVTTTTTLAGFVEEIGGQHVSVDSFTFGPQDPHFVEAKPSFMLKARKADLLVAVGLNLEIGWLPNIIVGSRNPRIAFGSKGYFETGQLIEPMQVPTQKVDRAMGDIHGFGNPHFMLDPTRAQKVARGIANKLSELDPLHASYFTKRAEKLIHSIDLQVPQWQQRIQKTGITHIVTYHQTLFYFINRFGLTHVASIEPKPGIPPSAKHIHGLIKIIAEKKPVCMMIESFFESNSAEKIQNQTGTHFEVVATEINATQNTASYIKLIESLVTAIERCAKDTYPERKLQ
ncbi:MAG: zinc ABC transporter substrate-binding protein [Deltaproteobacteria bacterium]|nr:zinc ABC transporter substrate-binding protein [Deltaproteobacteria bacterium]